MEFVRGNLFRIGGLDLAPNSAECHYWRVERKYWPFCFKQIKEAGFSIISTYVPWNFHEYEQGKFDFTGETDPQRDLDTFLKEARQTGLRVILKPGPWICAEWKNGGHPDYLFEDSSMVARDAEDEPVRAGNCADVEKGYVPCYAHPDFLKHVRRYYKAFVDAIRDHLHPNGNVFAIQLDNELSHCFQSGVFEADYHELITMNLYPRFIKDRYKEIERLNSIYLSDFEDFSHVAPPRKLEIKDERDLVKYFDWIEFKERYLATYLVQLKKMLTDEAVEALFFTNIRWATDFVAPTNWPMFNKYAGFTGIDIYWPHDYYEVSRYIRYLDGITEMPWSPEFMAGLWADDPEGMRKFRPITERQQRFIILSSMASGLMGANYYMFVERDHWYDSPVDREGKRSKGWDFHKKLNEILAEKEYFEVEKNNNVGVVQYQPYTRYSYLDPEKPFAHIKDLMRRLLPDLCTDLGRLGVDYTVVDPSVPESLEGMDILFVPMADFVEEGAIKKYAQLAQQGTHLVFFGVAPVYDLLMRKSSVFKDLFGMQSVHHFVVERVTANDMEFRTLAMARLRPDENWESLMRDGRDNTYAARRKLGEGTVHFLGYDAASNCVPEKMIYLDRLLGELGARRPVTVSEPAIEAYMRKSEKHTFMFLINPDENRREEERPSVQTATVNLDTRLMGLHADSITFVDLLTGERRNEPLAAVREGLIFEIENYDAKMFEVIPEYGR